ncbi:unnamed protein product [Lactuca saligna]|uniref:Uncharacterized protein n=1 Tax=Lactuca saligna TaxID=75948 RepID=A0AA35YWU0_LACSI|nr:unnamed protein product [Lactuca saligna]
MILRIPLKNLIQSLYCARTFVLKIEITNLLQWRIQHFIVNLKDVVYTGRELPSLEKLFRLVKYSRCVDEAVQQKLIHCVCLQSTNSAKLIEIDWKQHNIIASSYIREKGGFIFEWFRVNDNGNNKEKLHSEEEVGPCEDNAHADPKGVKLVFMFGIPFQ